MGATKKQTEAPKPSEPVRHSEVPPARLVKMVGLAQDSLGYVVFSLELSTDDPRLKVVTKRSPRQNAFELARTQLEGIYFKAMRGAR